MIISANTQSRTAPKHKVHGGSYQVPYAHSPSTSNPRKKRKLTRKAGKTSDLETHSPPNNKKSKDRRSGPSHSDSVPSSKRKKKPMLVSAERKKEKDKLQELEREIKANEEKELGLIRDKETIRGTIMRLDQQIETAEKEWKERDKDIREKSKRITLNIDKIKEICARNSFGTIDFEKFTKNEQIDFGGLSQFLNAKITELQENDNLN